MAISPNQTRKLKKRNLKPTMRTLMNKRKQNKVTTLKMKMSKSGKMWKAMNMRKM